MGLDYEYHLHFPREEMWNVLEAIAAMAKPNGQTFIVLPDREIVLAFRSNYENQRLVFDESVKGFGFDTSLYFNADELLQADWENSTLSDEIKNQLRGSKGRFSVGSIHLSVYPDLRNTHYIGNWKAGICLFEFAAATTSMSLLFEKSKSIKRAFKRLLKQHKGLYGVLHDTDYNYQPILCLWPPDMRVTEAKTRFLIGPTSTPPS